MASAGLFTRQRRSPQRQHSLGPTRKPEATNNPVGPENSVSALVASAIEVGYLELPQIFTEARRIEPDAVDETVGTEHDLSQLPRRGVKADLRKFAPWHRQTCFDAGLAEKAGPEDPVDQ